MRVLNRHCGFVVVGFATMAAVFFSKVFTLSKPYIDQYKLLESVHLNYAINADNGRILYILVHVSHSPPYLRGYNITDIAK